MKILAELPEDARRMYNARYDRIETYYVIKETAKTVSHAVPIGEGWRVDISRKDGRWSPHLYPTWQEAKEALLQHASDDVDHYRSMADSALERMDRIRAMEEPET